jgi:uncharacterized MAPEG superfamily protein
MSTDLKYLAFTAMLTAALWIPYVIAQVMTNGRLKPANYVDPTPRPLPLWGRRADRVYLNAIETFAPFATLVILIQLTGCRSSGCASCTPSSIGPQFPTSARSFSRSASSRSSASLSN